jgi:RHS repeat-associated protein
VNGLTGGTETTYAYDGDGLRTAKTNANANTTAFTWDRSGGLPLLLAETTATATTHYLYGPGAMPLARIDAAGEVVYYHGDQLGSTRALSDAAGEVVGSATYEAYGRTSASSGNVSQPFGFAGQYTDAETGFQYLRARYYDPATAQFLTKDPLVAQSGQPYAYANNSPHNFTDPSGQIAWLAVVPLVWGAIELGGAVIDGVSTAKTLTDPCASGWDKAVSGGLFAFGAMAPGFGYSTGGRVAAEAGTPLSRVDRAGSALKDDPFHRSVSWVVDNPAAQRFSVTGGDGVQRQLYQLPGEVNGKPGVFEWMVGRSGSNPVITHQRFIPGGGVTGSPNQVP